MSANQDPKKPGPRAGRTRPAPADDAVDVPDAAVEEVPTQATDAAVEEADAPAAEAPQDELPVDAPAPRRSLAEQRAEKAAAAAVARGEDEPVFSRERILGADGVVLTGQPSYVIAGALHGNSAEDFTVAEIVRLIDEFHARPVVQEG